MSQKKDYSIVDGLNKAWNLNQEETIFYNYILKSQIKRRDDIIKVLKTFEVKYPNINRIITNIAKVKRGFSMTVFL